MPQRGGPHAPVCLNRGAVGKGLRDWDRRPGRMALLAPLGLMDTPMHGHIQSRGRIDEIGRSYGPGHVHVGSTQPHLTETMDTKFSHADST